MLSTFVVRIAITPNNCKNSRPKIYTMMTVCSGSERKDTLVQSLFSLPSQNKIEKIFSSLFVDALFAKSPF
jgi:hypothetical protein